MDVAVFVKATVGQQDVVAQVQKMDAVAQRLNHGRELFAAAYRKRAGAEVDAVRVGGVLRRNPLQVFLRADNTRQSQYRERRVVGVNGHIDAGLFGNGDHRLNEVRQVLAQLVATNFAIGVDETQKDFFVVGGGTIHDPVDKALGHHNDVVGQFFGFFLRHALQIGRAHVCTPVTSASRMP